MRGLAPLLACALAVGVAACGNDSGDTASDWKAVAAASGTARAERITRMLAENEGAVGARLDAARKADPEFAATEPAMRAAADLLDAYRPGKPDPTLVGIADRSNRWARHVRAAALRALVRLHEPSAVRLLSGRAWTLDAAEEENAAAWISLAEALAPAGDPATRRKTTTALEGVASQRALEGDAAGAASARALAARLSALEDPASAPGEKDVEALRSSLARGTPDK